MKFVTRTLGEICDEVGGTIRTGPFGSQLHQSDYRSEGLPVVMPKNIVDNRMSIEDIVRIGDEDAARLYQHKLKKAILFMGEGVLSVRGRCGIILVEEYPSMQEGDFPGPGGCAPNRDYITVAPR
jgi:hypothetical protein